LNRESWSFPFNFDIARRYAEHLDCQRRGNAMPEHADYKTSHYGEQRDEVLLLKFL